MACNRGRLPNGIMAKIAPYPDIIKWIESSAQDTTKKWKDGYWTSQPFHTPDAA